jgi:hypothetical protein
MRRCARSFWRLGTEWSVPILRGVERFGEKGWQSLHDYGCYDADADYLAYQTDDVGGVVFAVGVGVAFYLVLIDDPFKGGAGAEAVIEGLGWDGGES